MGKITTKIFADGISVYEDKRELQEFLDKWCTKQDGTTTYYPCYKEYVRVQKEWFDWCFKNWNMNLMNSNVI